MTELKRWIQRESQKTQKGPSLEAALLGIRPLVYVFYRLRIFAITNGLVIGVHLAEFFFLRLILTPSQLALAVVIKSVALIIGSFWWGALESLRGSVRQLVSARFRHHAIELISSWVMLSCFVTFLILLTGGLWLKSSISSLGIFTVFHLYVISSLVPLALQLPVRAWNSGIFALRRIYRPTFIIILVECSTFALTFFLKPWLGNWSFPCSLLIGELLALVTGIYYTALSYRRERLPIPGLISLKKAFRLLSKEADLLKALEAGGAYSALRLGSASVVLWALANKVIPEDSRPESLVYSIIALHLASPLVSLAGDWASLFYFDFSKLSAAAYSDFKKRFRFLMHAVGIGISTLAWLGIIAVLLTIAEISISPSNCLILFIVMVLRSNLAVFQVAAFAENRFGIVALAALPQLALVMGGVLVAGLGSGDGGLKAGFGFLCLAGMIISFFLRGREKSLLIERSALPMTGFLSRLNPKARPFRLGSIVINPRGGEISGKTLAMGLVQKVPGVFAASLPTSRVLLLAQAAEFPIPTKAEICLWLAGLAEEVNWSASLGESSSPSDVWKELGMLVPIPAFKNENKKGTDLQNENLPALFLKKFPNGIVFDFQGRVNFKPLEALGLKGTEIFDSALRFSLEQRNSLGLGLGQVSAFCPQGRMQKIFWSPPHTDQDQYGAWLRELRRENWFYSIPGSFR